MCALFGYQIMYTLAVAFTIAWRPWPWRHSFRMSLDDHLTEQTRTYRSAKVFNCNTTVRKYIWHIDSCDICDSSDSIEEKTYIQDLATFCISNGIRWFHGSLTCRPLFLSLKACIFKDHKLFSHNCYGSSFIRKWDNIFKYNFRFASVQGFGKQKKQQQKNNMWS